MLCKKDVNLHLTKKKKHTHKNKKMLKKKDAVLLNERWQDLSCQKKRDIKI